MQPVDGVTVHVVVDNTTDMQSRRPPHVVSEMTVLREAGMEELAGENLCSAHHGLSLMVTVATGDEQHSVLFDGGPDGYAIERNSRRMGLNLGQIEAVVLSHGHYDHSGGLPAALRLIREANEGRTVPLHLHPGAFVRRGRLLPDGQVLPMAETPSPAAFEGMGAHVFASGEAQELLGGRFALSGEIPRVSFERGLRNHVRQTGAGWEDDPLILDERFMAVHLRGRGLVVFTGCSHAGVVNVLTHCRDLFPGVPLYGLIGGLHLVPPNEDLIALTVEAIADLGLQVVIAGHCTGWRALQALVAKLGDGVVDPLAVGSRHVLRAGS